MKVVALILLAVALATFAQSQVLAQEPMSPRSECQLRLATGKRGKGFSRLFRDIQAVCSEQVKLCEIESEGGLQNTVLLSANEADMGFVQVDTLHAMKQSDANIATLQSVLPANANLLHILALRSGYTVRGERSLATLFMREEKTVRATKLSDLKGLPVAAVGSAQLLGRLLDRSFDYGFHFIDMESDEQAIAALKAGEVAAVLCMNGWPSATVDALERRAGITLVSYDLPAKAPYQLVRKNYPKLGVFNLPFLAAPNLLVTRPFKPDGVRGGYVATLRRCIVSHLDMLREGAFEAGWQEVKSSEESYGWPRFGAVGR